MEILSTLLVGSLAVPLPAVAGGFESLRPLWAVLVPWPPLIVVSGESRRNLRQFWTLAAAQFGWCGRCCPVVLEGRGRQTHLWQE